MSNFSGDETAPFFGFLGAAAALVFSCMGAAYGTAKSGVGVASMGVMRPELVMKSIVPVVMAGVLGIYGLIIAVIISTGINPKAKSYYLFDGYAHLSSGLACGLAGLSAGMAIGIVGDAGVRANAQQPKLFVGMILILIFAEALALYGLIVGIILSSRAGSVNFSMDMDTTGHRLSRHIDVTLLHLLKSHKLRVVIKLSCLPQRLTVLNNAAERVSHCGVLEFIAEEGMIYMPYWMMENLLLQEGDTVRVKNVTLPKGKYVKLQPHTKDFLDISNPKAILETTLRNYSCLTTGDSIMVAYNNKKYYIDIIETKPSNAITIIETDCEVDFAPPLDYKEPEKPVTSVPPSKATSQAEEVPAETEPKFSPFTGAGRRLDGRPLSYQPPPASSSGSKDKQPAVADGSRQPSLGSSSQNTARQSQGKLVFGSNTGRTPKETQRVESGKETKQEQPEKKEEPKFQAFTGKKYSLKG
uniref:V-type proton ATPase proteolipid subunit n=1 Tax=Salix viminalis TaxID=40686 RepID=A0A6N2L807_SALVM